MHLPFRCCPLLFSVLLLASPFLGVAQVVGTTQAIPAAPRPTPHFAPYSLVEEVHHQLLLGDGTTLTQDSEKSSYFDSHGRSRMESPGPDFAPGLHHGRIFIRDPVAKISIQLEPDLKLARISHDQPRPQSPEALAYSRAYGEARSALSNAEDPPHITREKLGESTYLGYKVEGTRSTIETPVGALGNDRPLRTVEETWTYSLPLVPRGFRPIILRSTSDDPRFGRTERKVTKLDIGEPDPSVFQIPADYKVFDDKPAAEATAQAPQ